MPGKTTKKTTKPPAGNSGLASETTSQKQNPDQTMSPDASSVAAQQLPRHETQADESNATIKACDDLFDTSDDQNATDGSPPQLKDQAMNDGTEEEDVFLLPVD